MKIWRLREHLKVFLKTTVLAELNLAPIEFLAPPSLGIYFEAWTTSQASTL